MTAEERIFEIDSVTGAITGLTDQGKSFTEFCIPAEIDGVKVERISDNAFNCCPFLETIVIPFNIQSIGDNAFKNCMALTKVVIQNGVTTIGFRAFSGCIRLQDITIPKSVATICDEAFLYCWSLEAIYVDKENPSYTSHEGILYDKKMSKIIKCPQGKSGSYAIPTGVEQIRFTGCSSLTDIVIPNSVTHIGAFAFEHCKSLKSITIPSSVMKIDDYAFRGCSSLKEVIIANNSLTLGVDVFKGCPVEVIKKINRLTAEDIAKAIETCAGGEVIFETYPFQAYLFIGMNDDGTLCTNKRTKQADRQYIQSGWDPYVDVVEVNDYGEKTQEWFADYGYRLIENRDKRFMYFCQKLLEQIKKDFLKGSN